MSRLISVERGSYGQWVVTAEVDKCFVNCQYYFYSKCEAIAEARVALRCGVFGGGERGK